MSSFGACYEQLALQAATILCGTHSPQINITQIKYRNNQARMLCYHLNPLGNARFIYTIEKKGYIEGDT